MRRIPAVFFFIFLSLLAGLICGRLASASSDFNCTQTWKLVYRSYEGCSNQGLLAPANDTRVNLLLLMADLHAAHYAAAFAAQPPQAQESPRFDWETIAARFAPPGKTPAPSADDDAQTDRDTCPATLDPADGFVAEVKADPTLAPEEREALLAARRALRRAESKETLAKAAKAAPAVRTGQAAFTLRVFPVATADWAAMAGRAVI
jgi:hypothetical protein